MATIEETFNRLNKSTLRARFHLSEKDKKYVNEKGIDVIKKHAEDFIENVSHEFKTPLAKRIIDLHQGEIFVQSERGKGTVFTVRLPSGR